MKKLIFVLMFLLFSSAAQAALTLLSQPTDQTVRVGEAVTLSVKATSNRTIRYYWYRNGTMIGNKTPSITLDSLPAGPTVFTCLLNDGKIKVRCKPFTVTVVTGNSLKITWRTPAYRVDGTKLSPGEISHYKIYSSQSAQGEMKFLVDAGGNEGILDGFPAGTFYFAMSTVDKTGLEGPKTPMRLKVVFE